MHTAIDPAFAPRTDQPALDDPTTAALFDLTRARGRSLWKWLLLTLVNLLGVLLVTSPVVAVLWVLFFTGMAFPVVYPTAMVGLWTKPARKLLESKAWRPVAVRVVRGPGSVLGTSVLKLGDVGMARASGLHATQLTVVERTGTAWIVGPDSGGRLALRVEGSPMARPARLTGGDVQGKPFSPVPDLPSGWARFLLRVTWGSAASLLAVVGMWTLGAVTFPPEFGYTRLTLHLVSTLMVAAALTTLFAPAPSRMLARTRTARWVRVEAKCRHRVPRTGGLVRARVTIRVEDGPVKLTLPCAPLDLLAAIEASGTLWLGQPPVPSTTIVVGFPDYPLVALAKVTQPG